MPDASSVDIRLGGAFRVAEWVVLPDRCVITDGGTESHLRPKVMELLVLLAETPGRVVSHDEIVDRVWGKEFIADSALPGIVSELRSAFGDTTQNPRVIETIPKRGYRLVAPVAREPAPNEETVSAPGRRDPFPKSATLAGVAVAILAVVAATFWFRRQPQPAAESEGTPRLAVLPFEEIGEVSEPYFAAGLVDELTSRLAAHGGLSVTSRDTAAVDDGAADPVAIGRKLGVDYVVTGTVRWESEADHVSRVRLTPQLIDVADAIVVFSSTFDRSIDDIFSVQTEIADLVIRGVGATVGATPPTPGPTPDPEAYRLFLRARQLDNHFESPEEQLLAISLYERGTEIDPAFAQGWARLAIVHSRVNHLGYDRSAARRAKAQAALQRAQALAPERPDVIYAGAVVEYFVNENYAASLEQLDAAERLLPEDAGNSELRGYLLRRLGRWNEALEALLEAQSRAPDEPWYACEVGITRMVLGDYEAADRDFALAIELSPDRQTAYELKAHNALLWRRSTVAARAELERMPRVGRTSPALEAWFIALCDRRYAEAFAALEPLSASGSAHRWYFFPRGLLDGQVYLLTGDDEAAHDAFDEAREALERRVADNPEDSRARSALGIAYAGLGREADAVRAGETAVRQCPMERDAVRGGFYLEGLARIHVMNGELDAAVAVLEQLLSQPVYPQAVPLLDLDPRWAPLREHPRFAALLATSLKPVRQRTTTIP